MSVHSVSIAVIKTATTTLDPTRVAVILAGVSTLTDSVAMVNM